MSGLISEFDEKALALYELNKDYDRNEKFFRMFTGCSTEPVSFENGIVEIEVRLPDRILEESKSKQENVIRSLIRKWLEAIPGAKGYRAHIYSSGRAEAGFVLPSQQLCQDGKVNPDAVAQLAEALKALGEAETIDVKIDERAGSWPEQADRVEDAASQRPGGARS